MKTYELDIDVGAWLTTKAKIELYSRTGTLAPGSTYIWFEGKRLTPREQRLFDVRINAAGYIRFMYEGRLKEFLQPQLALYKRVIK